MGNLLNRLLIMLNDCQIKSTNYRITMTLLLNFHQLATLSIGKVADLCNVSKSTISKYIRVLGYEDYADFKADSIFKENRFGFSLNYNSNIAQFLETQGIERYIATIQNDLSLIHSTLDMNKVTKLAQYLAEYREVAAFGLLFSEIGALDLQSKLAYNGKFITTHLNDLKQKQFIYRANKKNLIIIYSNSGRYLQLEQLSEFRESKNFSTVRAKIVLITANTAMENDPNIDLCLTFKHCSNIQTHANLYPLINDLIVMKYRQIVLQNN
ncbi:RpiR family transcriptional regulator [Lonepinella koalarum]|uniref:RpiR family transcriptional regulator n=3 Tax=Lonepinella koalarum TaxID=53417 RepID=A0A4R1KUK2_9PAST|nr:MurR/RpiR family transcriptional regulator [Lonepinella koalarum]MDH2927567.1 RpiR family transcriptional regulator [Lonepinella koalarum]TCK68290.1 RpiR family transcriptional regulator [Lonepinella koalarum]TFJ89548.1 MurR/RpiR family transcriptional regulator [Lonepinella koalarum]